MFHYVMLLRLAYQYFVTEVKHSSPVPPVVVDERFHVLLLVFYAIAFLLRPPYAHEQRDTELDSTNLDTA